MTEKVDPHVEYLKERAWRETRAVDAGLAAGRIDEATWHAAMAELVAPAYLTATNPYAQAGHSGDAASWQASRGITAHTLHKSGTFLDGGCASGVMMESVVSWGRRRGHHIEPYGVEIVPALADLARRRLPQWAGQIAVGNLRSFRSPWDRSFDFVLVRPEYAPHGRRGDLVRHVLDHLLAPGGRLIVFVGTEESGERRAEVDIVQSAGVRVHGRIERPHPGHPGLRRRLFWIDAPGGFSAYR